MLGLGLSRAESAVCAKCVVKDESWGWGSCSIRLAGTTEVVVSLLWVPTPSASYRPVLLWGERLPDRLEASNGSHHGWQHQRPLPAPSVSPGFVLRGWVFLFSYPSLSLVCWRQGSRMKECLGQQEKQELFCRKTNLPLIDLGIRSYQTGQGAEWESWHMPPAHGWKALKCHLLQQRRLRQPCFSLGK